MLLNHLFQFRIVSKEWSRKNKTVAPKIQTAKIPTRLAMPMARARSGRLRQPDVKTVLVANADWWNKGSPPGNLTQVDILPVKSMPRAAAALLPVKSISCSIPAAGHCAAENQHQRQDSTAEARAIHRLRSFQATNCSTQRRKGGKNRSGRTGASGDRPRHRHRSHQGQSDAQSCEFQRDRKVPRSGAKGLQKEAGSVTTTTRTKAKTVWPMRAIQTGSISRWIAAISNRRRHLPVIPDSADAP